LRARSGVLPADTGHRRPPVVSGCRAAARAGGFRGWAEPHRPWLGQFGQRRPRAAAASRIPCGPPSPTCRVGQSRGRATQLPVARGVPAGAAVAWMVSGGDRCGTAGSVRAGPRAPGRATFPGR
jgi:hypothetical protein